MRYLAAAWNANDLDDLKHVTDPAARDQLNGMHSEAIALALDHCVRRPAGDYDCFFTHEFPNDEVRQREDADGDGIGHAEFLVGPADRPGWYMTVYVGCGG